MYNFCYIFLLFIMYSIMGWIVEVINSYVRDKKFINRGFCIGPYCPIYGVGVLLIINLLKNFMNTPVALFILAMFICMLLEYFSSYIMEKLFNARWWDYSNRRFNINGRICLETAIPFGLGGMFIMYVINPLFEGLLNRLSSTTLLIIGTVFLTVFVIDELVSLSVVYKIKKVDANKFEKNKDDTEDINKKVRDYLIEYSPLTKRLMDSFPNFRITINNFKKEIKDKVEKNKRENK